MALWERVPPVPKDDMSILNQSKRIKLYADEDIEEGAVEAIREYRQVNIKSAREAGNVGKDDSFQVAFAKREKRFLLTKNAKDFWPEREVPFNSTYGIIIVEGSEEAIDSYVTALQNVLDIVVPFEDSFIGSKVWVTPTRVTVKRVEGGRVVTEKYKLERNEIFRWTKSHSRTST
jgi:Domain of unknown function (DUF5615)